MGQDEEPQNDPQNMFKWFFTKVQKQFSGGRMVLKQVTSTETQTKKPPLPNPHTLLKKAKSKRMMS